MTLIAYLVGTNMGIEAETLEEIRKIIAADVPEYEKIAGAPVSIIMDYGSKISVIMRNGMAFVYTIREKEEESKKDVRP